ncbi:MAG TPA: bifunctional UDP-sugar hydrolase/5'-nucleotidase, partial [Smithellaceae bacterium]|nr:bifunctional UDP-sugar hydrolase/5'-nucleotidase [Smithellaceae bacterium]
KEGRELVLLFTHDLHSYFLPHRILTPGGEQLQQGGYAKLANLLNEQRILHKNETLRIDAGDFAMGTLFHASFSEEAAELRLMGKMGYDVATLGNHDFDFHSAGLAAALQAARTKSKLLPALVASNVVFSKEKKEDDPLEQAFREYPVRDYTVVERNGLRIGIFGIMGRDAADDTPFAAPVKFADPVETARRVVGILRNKEKVDIIICLSHSGTSPVSRKSEDEELAREAPQIDVIISGHTHTVLPKPLLIGKTIIASAGCYGEYLGILKINHAPGEGVKLGSYELKNVREDIPDNKVIAAEIARYKETVNRESLAGDRLSFDQVVAQSYFNMESLAAAYAHPREMGLGNMITDAYRFAVKKAEGRDHEYVSMSIAPLGVIRDSFQKGKITVADVFQTLSLGVGTDSNPGYPLVAFYVSGGEVKDALEVETTVAPLLKEGAHLQVSGIKFSYNPHRMFFDRVTEVLVQNEKGQYKPLEKQKLYRVCANLYAAEMLNYVSRATYGLLKLEPKDKNGRVLPDLKQAIVYANKNSPQSKELKEWKALLRYMQSFPRDSGIPLVPAQYKTTEGRILAVPSWNPVKLIAGGNAITYGALAVLVILLGLAVFLVRYLARRFRAAPPPDPGAGN